MNTSPLDMVGVSEDKKYQIAYAALTLGAVTRAELSDICSVSAMTVGRVVTKMLEAGLLISEKRSLGIGPHTEILRPSPDINTVFFHLTDRKLKLTVCDACQNIIFEREAVVNESLPYEANISALAMSAYGKLKSIIDKGLCGYAAATDGAVSAKELDILSSVFPNAKLHTVKPYVDYICDLMRRDHPDKNIFLIRIGRSIELSLICESHRIGSNNPIVNHVSALDIKDAILGISDTVAPLLRVLTPDKIVIESDMMPIDRHFIHSLKVKISERTRHGDKIPDIVSGEGLHLAARSAADITAIELASVLSGKKKS